AGAERLGERLQVLGDAGGALGGEGGAPLRALGAQVPTQRPLGLLDGVLVLVHARNLARADETGPAARHGGECSGRTAGLHPMGVPRPTTGAQHPWTTATSSSSASSSPRRTSLPSSRCCSPSSPSRRASTSRPSRTTPT